MKLKAVILQNFRRYKNKTVVKIDQLTAFIGRNDSGKSTILDALDIFFEGGTIKIDPDDASYNGEKKNVRIGAIFENLPTMLDLDAGAKTSLADEKLLNADGDLEIIKIYDCSVSGRVRAPEVFAYALHPSMQGFDTLLQKKNPELKRLVKEAGVEAKCQLNNNPSMRKALYAVADNLVLTEKEVPLNKEDAKNIWEAIKRNLPVYVLFQSDRASRAQDPEVQNPMKLAIQKALAENHADLESISMKVEKMAEETAKRTIEQMKLAYPDIELASVLKPSFEKPNWGSVFKLDLESDDGIPLNKRGSGVRRLILLSFFQADAERVRQERTAKDSKEVPVIYAIEEPETSQHPDNQGRIIDAFIGVSKGGDQVLLTTHVPGLAGQLDIDCLRFIDNDLTTGGPRVREGSPEVLSEIAETLGVFPDVIHNESVRVAVAVEGPSDVDALISFSNILTNAGKINNIDHNRVFWTLGGGSTLKDWVDRGYLDSLNIPQIFIFDSDRESEKSPIAKGKLKLFNEIKKNPNRQAFLTKKREIENYMDIATVARISQNRIVIDEGIDPDYGDLEGAFEDALKTAKIKYGNKLEFYPEDHDENQLALSKTKKIITSYVMRNMTEEEVIDRGQYVNSDGKSCNEIIEWLMTIQEKIKD